MDNLCIFEDGGHKSLLPLVYNRPVYDLRCGMFSLGERITSLYPDIPVTLFCRDYLADVVREKSGVPVNSANVEDDGRCLFINGRLLMHSPVPLDGEEEIGIADGKVVYARLKNKKSASVTNGLFLEDNVTKRFSGDVKIVETDAVMANYFWDLISHNNSMIEDDFERYATGGSIKGRLYEGVYLVNRDNIFVGEGSSIKPGCVLDAEDGPIYIGCNVTIASNCSIEGNTFIGDCSSINSQTRIRNGVNIGRSCKIGGEVSQSIIQGFSNKQHDGFLGNAYLGAWVNLGADTVNSNLKNTYEHVNIKLNGNTVNTGQMFLGMAMGDHSKTAINTTFMTGSIVGIGSNIVTSHFPPKFIPSFSWCIDKGIMPQDLASVLSTAEKMMARRNVAISDAEREMYKTLYNITSVERIKSGTLKG